MVIGCEIANCLIWGENPADPTGTWIEHIVATDNLYMSMDVGDVDGDGDVDIVAGVHKGNGEAYIFENRYNGANWTQRIVDPGDPTLDHHDGTQLVDLDLDGDLDIISIGWTRRSLVIYENLAITSNNLPPRLNAGIDQAITFPDTAVLNAIVTDDGRPDPPGVLTTTWSEVNGPGVVNFADPSAVDTTAAFSQPGIYTLRLTANDGQAVSFDEVVITIESLNDPPDADDQIVSVDEDSSVVVTLTATDPDGEPLTYTIVTLPANGSVTLNGQDATYTPDPDYVGPDSFGFVANDGTVDSNEATVTITVIPVNDQPVASDQSPTTDEDTPVDFTLTATDVDGDALTFSVVTQPLNGSLSLNGAIATYTPDLNYFGPDSFTFKANDGVDDSNVATVSITINSVNDPPVANDQSSTTNEDIPVDFTLTSADVEGDALTYSIVTQPVNGLATLNGTIATYTPDLNFFGSDSFTFVANDGIADSIEATVTITVNSVNDPPTANFIANPPSGVVPLTVDFDASGSSDVDGTISTYAWDFGDANIGSEINVSHAFTVEDTYQVTLTITDNEGALDTVSTSITVVAANEPPVANGQSTSTDEDTPVDITLSGTDSDGDSLTYSIVDQPANGSVVLIGADATYTPGPDYNGSDSFTFKANDGFEDGNTATITITINPINDAPVANDQYPITNEDTPIDITLTATDIEGDALTYSLTSQPSFGTVTLNGNIATYTPPLNYYGSSSFTFIASDGTDDSNTAVVTVTVNEVNDQPEANGQSVATDEDTPLDITLTGSDADADELTYSIVTGPSSGSISLIGNLATYTPNPDYNGLDSFAFVSHDGLIDSDAATVSITVNSINDLPTAEFSAIPLSGIAPLTVDFDASASSDPDGTITSYSWDFGDTASSSEIVISHEYTAVGMFTVLVTITDNDDGTDVAARSITVLAPNIPPVASDQNSTTAEDTPVDIALSATDPDGDSGSLSYYIVSPPVIGSVTFVGPNATYTPNPDDFGSDSFTFRAFDGQDYSNIATVSIVINSVNDPPFANDQSSTTEEDTPVDFTLTASDVDGDTLTYIIVTSPTNGSITLNGPDLNYTPNPDYNGSDSFTFVANDGFEDSNIATVSITINSVNDPPVANDQSVSTDEDTEVNIALTATDIEGNSLTYTIVTDAINGSVSLNDAIATYTPDLDYFGPDSFAFTVNDGFDDSNTAIISITVDPVNDSPTASFIAGPASGEVPLTVEFDAFASSDIDGSIDIYTWDYGDGSATGSGEITSHDYTLDGIFTVTLTVTDNEGATDSASTTITALPTIPLENILTNPSFEAGKKPWRFYSKGAASLSLGSPGYQDSYAAVVSISKVGSNIQLYQAYLTLEPATNYVLEFAAKSNEGANLSVYLHKHKSPYTNYGLSNHQFDLTTSWQTFSVTFVTKGFTSTVSDARLRFWFPPYSSPGDEYWIDDVKLYKVESN